MSLELSTQCGIPMGLEQHLIEMGIIPPTPLEEIGQVANTREERLAYFAALPTTDEHGEYLF